MSLASKKLRKSRIHGGGVWRIALGCTHVPNKVGSDTVKMLLSIVITFSVISNVRDHYIAVRNPSNVT